MRNFLKQIKILLAIVLLFSLISSVYSLEITGLASKDITGKATSVSFNVELCINSPPTIISTNCPSEIYTIQNLSCRFNGSDADLGQTINYSSYFITNQTLFEINSTTGEINRSNFNLSNIGAHSAVITVRDIGGCSQNTYSTFYNLNIIRYDNNAPVCIDTVKNKNISQGSNLLIMMSVYCEDADGDVLSYSYQADRPEVGFRFEISGDELLFITESWFYGEVYVSFSATDTFDASDSTNQFRILVERTQEEEETETVTSSSSSSSPKSSDAMPGARIINCIPKWVCGNWSSCLPQSYMVRECVDTKNCNISILKPAITLKCDYVPTCVDGIMNGDEEGVDCGGSCLNICKAENTCFDGIKNGDEEGVDCGGSCPNTCDSYNVCFNGIKDSNEEGVDCGGVCEKKCPKTELPLGSINMNIQKIALIIFILILAYIMAYYIHKNRRYLARLLKKLRMRKGSVSLENISGESLMQRLDDIEKDISKTKTEILLSKLIGIFDDLIFKLTASRDSLTKEDIARNISKCSIKQDMKEVILSMYSDIDEIEFSKRKTTPAEMLSLIYESRNMVMLTVPSEGYIFSKMADLASVGEEDALFKDISLANQAVLLNDFSGAEKIRAGIKASILSKNIKNRFLINAYNRLLKIERYKYEQKKQSK